MIQKFRMISVFIFSFVFFVGCAQKNTDLLDRDKQIKSLTKKLDEANMKLKESDRLNENKDANAVANSLVPPNAKPGQCFAKVEVPATYKMITEEKLIREARTDTQIIPETYKTIEEKVLLQEETTKSVSIPAVYKEVEERVLVKPETVEKIVVPATYKTVTKKVLIKPEKTEIIPIPAVYETETQKVIATPERTEWKKGRGEIEKVDNSTGEILCLVKIPATYKTVKKQVLVQEATTKKVITPAVYQTVKTKVLDTPETVKEVVVSAVYKTITKQVLETPSQTKEIIVPALYKTVYKKVVDNPAHEVTEHIPAEYITIKKRVIDRPSYLRWQEILCKTNTTSDVVRKLQEALKKKNYVVKTDGVYGKKTKEAVRKYQRDKGLNEGALTIETLKSLGLSTILN